MSIDPSVFEESKVVPPVYDDGYFQRIDSLQKLHELGDWQKMTPALMKLPKDIYQSIAKYMDALYAEQKAVKTRNESIAIDGLIADAKLSLRRFYCARYARIMELAAFNMDGDTLSIALLVDEELDIYWQNHAAAKRFHDKTILKYGTV